MARSVERWGQLWRGWEECHGWTVVKKAAAPAAKKGKEWKMGGMRGGEMRREPGTLVIGSATRMAREREAAKANLEWKKKVVDAKGKEKEVVAQQALSVVSDNISERSDTSDVRRMKESKFVWADDE